MQLPTSCSHSRRQCLRSAPVRAAGLHDVRSRSREREVALDGEAANGVPQLGTDQRQRELLAIVYLQRQRAEAWRQGRAWCSLAALEAQPGGTVRALSR